MKKGLLIVVSGPSGVGKGTVLKEVMAENSNIYFSVSATTRDPRPGEIPGVTYHYLTKEQFLKNIEAGLMLEYAEYCDNYYGTLRQAVDRMRDEGKDVLLEIESCGAMQVMKNCSDAVTIFIAPPSMEELRRRLTERGTEKPEVIESRLAKAEEEMQHAHLYTHYVVNDTVENAKNIINQILAEYKNI